MKGLTVQFLFSLDFQRVDGGCLLCAVVLRTTRLARTQPSECLQRTTGSYSRENSPESQGPKTGTRGPTDSESAARVRERRLVTVSRAFVIRRYISISVRRFIEDRKFIVSYCFSLSLVVLIQNIPYCY